ncbi:hypothetical protein TrRE_jg12517, partial [Triparma retinervis]
MSETETTTTTTTLQKEAQPPQLQDSHDSTTTKTKTTTTTTTAAAADIILTGVNANAELQAIEKSQTTTVGSKRKAAGEPIVESDDSQLSTPCATPPPFVGSFFSMRAIPPNASEEEKSQIS